MPKNWRNELNYKLRDKQWETMYLVFYNRFRGLGLTMDRAQFKAMTLTDENFYSKSKEKKVLNVDEPEIEVLKKYHTDEIVDLMICLEEEWHYQVSQLGRTEYQALVISIAEIIGTDTDRPEERIKVAASWLRFKTQ